MTKNELERRIESKDKEAILETFSKLRKSLHTFLIPAHKLSMLIFIEQLQDHIIKEME